MNSRNPNQRHLFRNGQENLSDMLAQLPGLYRALKHFGVETEMVLYPGEGHSPKKGSYNIDMFQRLLDWYDRHLGKTNGRANSE